MTVDLLHQILDLAEQHGLSVVLLLLMIMAWVIIFRWVGKKIDTVMGVVMTNLVHGRQQTVESMMQLDKVVKSILREAQSGLHANWVSLWRFHNGSYSIGKYPLPFMFLSITHEVTSGGVEPMYIQFKQLPISLFDIMAEDLLTKQIIFHDRDKQSTVPPQGMARAMHNLGARYGCLVPVRDEDGGLTGIFAVGFRERRVLSDDDQSNIINYGRRMAIALATLGRSGGAKGGDLDGG